MHCYALLLQMPSAFPERRNEKRNTVQGTNISHLGKRKIIFKSAKDLGDMLVPWRVCYWFVSF